MSECNRLTWIMRRSWPTRGCCDMEKKANLLLYSKAHNDGFSPCIIVSLYMEVNASLQKCSNETQHDSAEDITPMRVPFGRAVSVVSASTYSPRTPSHSAAI